MAIDTHLRISHWATMRPEGKPDDQADEHGAVSVGSFAATGAEGVQKRK